MTPPAEVVVAGWPLAATFALALGGERMIVRRRRAAVNKALHELRRPLQTMSLIEERESDPTGNGTAPAHRLTTSLDLAITAIDDLERVLNGFGSVNRPRPASCDDLVAGAIARWEMLATRLGVSLRSSRRACAGTVLVDRRRISQALDNLIANAIEHGGPVIEIGARVTGGQARIAVKDWAPRDWPAGQRPAPVAGPVASGRRGIGFRVVSSVARSHGGRFVFHRSPTGNVAIIDLPLATQVEGA